MYETTRVSSDIHADAICPPAFPMMIAITVDTCDLGYTDYSSSTIFEVRLDRIRDASTYEEDE
jgi:hypothetical protein